MSTLVFSPRTVQNVTVGASAASSAAFQAGITSVRLVSTTDCYVKFGSSPTANTTTSVFLPAGAVEYFNVYPGSKVSVLQSSVSGSLNVTELGR